MNIANSKVNKHFLILTAPFEGDNHIIYFGKNQPFLVIHDGKEGGAWGRFK
jgi:hypothetical protein